MNDVTPNNTYEALVLRCWSDPEFKNKLLSDPAGCIKSEGGSIPDGVDLEVYEDTETVLHLVIPARPVEVSDEDLEQVAGGIANPFAKPGAMEAYLKAPTIDFGTWTAKDLTGGIRVGGDPRTWSPTKG
jgi:hypothetical protein